MPDFRYRALAFVRARKKNSDKRFFVNLLHVETIEEKDGDEWLLDMASGEKNRILEGDAREIAQVLRGVISQQDLDTTPETP